MYPPTVIIGTHTNALPSPLSPIRPADPRAILVSVLLIVIAATATIRTATSMLAVLVFVCAWHTLATARASATARALGRAVPFAIVIVVLNAVLVAGEPVLTLGGRRVASREGLQDGVFFSLRLAVMLMAVSVLVSGTTPEALARGTHDLVRRISVRAAGRIAFFVFLSMGFVPMFVDEIERVRVAQSFRGAGFSGGIVRRVGSARAWLVPLVLSAVHRSRQLALAVELRHIRERLIPTIAAPHARAVDAVLLVSTFAVLIAASWPR